LLRNPHGEEVCATATRETVKEIDREALEQELGSPDFSELRKLATSCQVVYDHHATSGLAELNSRDIIPISGCSLMNYGMRPRNPPEIEKDLEQIGFTHEDQDRK
jgi:hypothetical protein